MGIGGISYAWQYMMLNSQLLTPAALHPAEQPPVSIE
jgi:hypothetical protein